VSNYNATYGGAMPYSMTAPGAPMGASQGAAMAGQQMLPAALTQKAQRTMNVPATPVKGLLKRATPRQPAMPMRPNMPRGLGADLGYV
jgi:hypothetical protein